MANKPVSKKAMRRAETPQTQVRRGVVPRYSLRQALSVPQAIADNFGGKPTPPHQVAMALNLSPASSTWRYLLAAAAAYAVTKGGVGADRIELTELGRCATAPTEEGDDIKAKAQAALVPGVHAKFFKKYDRSRFPPDRIAINVLREEFQVPADRCEKALEVIKDNGAFVGFIQSTKTGPFVTLDDPKPGPVVAGEPLNGPTMEESAERDETEVPPIIDDIAPKPAPASFKVFISHGKNLAVVDQVKDILGLYDIDYEVAIEEETAAIPVPQKVLTAMRRCAAGVMLVTADEQNRGEEGYRINTNVLIEIGAAFVLYDQQVVLLWDKRLKVPSNIQGLYRCEFEGSELTFSTGTKLARALKSFKDRRH